MPVVKPTWVRSRDGKIAGVCQGIATALEVDVILVRIIWLISVLFAFSGVWIYLVLAVALPHEDEIAESQNPKILGVCSRVAKRYNVEVGLVRVAAITLAIASFGGAFLLYLILHFVLPEDPKTNNGEKIVN